MSRTIFAAVVVLTAMFRASASGQPSPNQPDMSVDASIVANTITLLAKGLRSAYVFPEVGEKVAAMLEQRHARGEYASVSSAKAFSELVTRQMFEAARDKHLRLLYSSQVVPQFPVVTPKTLPPPSPRMLEQLRTSNYEFEKVEWFPGNIGYLKLNAFMEAPRGGTVAAGAMAFLENTDALIIDLRENGGGEPSMVSLLASYFFSGSVHLSSLAYRLEGTSEYDITQLWTLPYVPGERYLDKAVYILTSERTFSAAEEFTYDLQALKRATVIGATTAGGANPGGPYRLGDHFYAGMPRGRAINPVTNGNWEGTGIEPDVKVPATDALKVARRMALEALIKKTSDPGTLTALKQALAKFDAER